MKTLFYLLIILSFGLKCYSQIEQVDVKTILSNSTQNVIKYDSTEYVRKDDREGNRNFTSISKEHDKSMMLRFVGQEVLILPKSHKYLKNNEFSFYGYGNGHYRGELTYDENFYTTLERTAKLYKSIKAGLWDKSNSSFADDNDYNYVSDYNYLSGKKFRIADVVITQSQYHYKLINEENGDVLYYIGGEQYYTDMYNIHSPLLVVGYFEKLKSSYLNKDFIYVYSDIKTDKLTDNISGQPIENITNSEWKCTKVGLADYSDNPYQKVTFILDNNSGNQIALELAKLNKYFIYKAQYLKNIERERINTEKRNAELKEKTEKEYQERLAVIKEAENIKNRKIADDEKVQKRKDEFVNKYGDKFG
jgi:hypothetical protein